VFVDPAVSQAKFDREVAEFRGQQTAHHKRGIWLLDATFPDVFLVLMATAFLTIPKDVRDRRYIRCGRFPLSFGTLGGVSVVPAVFAVVINFENYDVEPPSVRFVHPVTREPLRAMDLPHPMQRIKRAKGPDGKLATGPNGEAMFEDQPLLQAEDLQRPAFLCLQGVREYHAHPGHTGDSWWLHRGTGVGRLAYLANILATYGIDTVQGIRLQMVFGGFNVNPRHENE